MLRDPRNIILEIGPHCLAPILDLVGPLEISAVQASNRVMLQGDQEFYRRWSIEALTGSVAVSLHLSFSPEFAEQMIHVRGTLASATVDFERNTYLLHHCDCTKARRLLNWNPVSDRAEIIRRGVQLPGSEFLV